MTLNVDPLEAIWTVVNGITLLLTIVAYVEARRDLAIAHADESQRHAAREFTARSNVRREALRVVVQVMLISIVIPGLFSDRPISLTPAIIMLILVPVVMLASTILDARDRTSLGEMLLEVVRMDRMTLALEASVQENIGLTREGIGHAQAASDKADAAYHEANTVNQKIADLTELVSHKEDKP
jgi:hypothetical protein